MRLQGAALIDSLVLAHGGMENWNKLVEMTFRGTDEWKKPYDKVLDPWPVERAAGQNSYRVHEGLGRVAIVTDMAIPAERVDEQQDEEARARAEARMSEKI